MVGFEKFGLIGRTTPPGAFRIEGVENAVAITGRLEIVVDRLAVGALAGVGGIFGMTEVGEFLEARSGCFRKSLVVELEADDRLALAFDSSGAI
jgi:hypothetical protein